MAWLEGVAVRRSFGLAARALAGRPIATALLALAIALPCALPFALNAVVSRAAAEMMARAESTPLLVASRGRAFGSVLSALTFRIEAPASIAYRQARATSVHGRYLTAPIYVRFKARGQPIVGTTLEYFDIRGLRIALGRSLAYAGECVLGAVAARRLEIGPGDLLLSAREDDLEAAGVEQLAMHVVGVLAESGTRDDHAVFVDVKTSWMIEGRIHGHGPDFPLDVLPGDEAFAPRFEDELTEETLGLFHPHGRRGESPISGIVVVPYDDETAAKALRKWPADGSSDLLRPADVMSALLPAVLPRQRGVAATIRGAALLGAVTAGLVLALSFYWRKDEIAAAVRDTGSRGVVLAASLIEGVIVLAAAVAMTIGLVGVVRRALEVAPLPVASVERHDASDHLDVFTVNEPLRYLAERLGGKQVTVSFPAPEGVDPAHWIPSPEIVARYQQADLVILNGGEYARWTTMASLRSRPVVDASREIRDRLIQLPGLRHAHDSDAPFVDPGTVPETWMDPALAGHQAETVADVLALGLEGGQKFVPRRLARLGRDLADIDARIRAATAPLVGDTVLFSSSVYAYFSRRYELEGPTLGWASDAAPTAEQWDDLAALLRARPARVMFWHAPPLPKTRDRLSEMGIRSAVYESGAAWTAGSDYMSVLRANVVRLEAATIGLAPTANPGSSKSPGDSGPS